MDEYISRETMIREIQQLYDGVPYNFPNSTYAEWQILKGKYMAFINYLKQQPTADVQPVKQWVKLHDKHPDTEGFYLVCDQYGECEVAEYIPDIKSWFTHKIKGEIRYWMLLPEPPKDGEQNG